MKQLVDYALILDSSIVANLTMPEPVICKRLINPTINQQVQ